MKETFGQRFNKLRKEKHLTQEDIAKSMGVSPQAVSKWENDLSAPDIMLLGDLSELLGVSVDELLGRKKEIEVVDVNKRKDINAMMLRVVIDSQGNKVRVNLPVSIIKIALENGTIPNINGNDSLKNIDFTQILSMIEQGVIGKLVEIESADGSTVSIFVE